jgi:two-component system, OmpR family, phosphate regulon sensor histidine kinase PhoR
MARLVDDLLSLSRIEQKRHIRPLAPVDFSALVGHVVDTLMPMAGEAGVSLRLDLVPDVVVAGDRDELVRVAENLIENAIKYGQKIASAGPVSPVDIKVLVRREVGVLIVRDHGDGIAPEHLPRLTERFYRIDAGQSRAKGGTGLGLALVKHIVAHHRGRFDFDSIVGEGSTFSVSIPMFGQNTLLGQQIGRHPIDV